MEEEQVMKWMEEIANTIEPTEYPLQPSIEAMDGYIAMMKNR
jgi:hypothetical protein